MTWAFLWDSPAWLKMMYSIVKGISYLRRSACTCVCVCVGVTDVQSFTRLSSSNLFFVFLLFLKAFLSWVLQQHRPVSCTPHLCNISALLHYFPQQLQSCEIKSQQQKQHLSRRHLSCHTRHFKVKKKQSIFSLIHFLCVCISNVWKKGGGRC